MELLQVDQYSFQYGSSPDEKKAVSNVSFSIGSGVITALVGESGSGKSTIAKSLIGLAKTEDSQWDGSILFEGRELTTLSEKEFRKLRGRKIAYLLQNPMSAFNPAHSVEHQLLDTIRMYHRCSKTEARNRMYHLLELVGFHNPKAIAGCFPHQFSGGMLQRAALAAAICGNPKLLIADEPTTSLDANIQKQVLQLLCDIAKKEKMALIIITHNLSIVRSFCENVIVMYQGELVEAGSVTEVWNHPSNPYTASLIQPLIQEDKDTNHGKPILSVSSLGKIYPRGKDAFAAVTDINFQLKEHSALGLLGESGCGKTTIARCIVGAEMLTTGAISYHGEDIAYHNKKQLKRIHQRIQLVFQDSLASFDPKRTLSYSMNEVLKALSIDGKEEREKKISAVLDSVKLEPEILQRFPWEISGGQCQRINIARALLVDPEILILDEPTSAIDQKIQKQILDLLIQLKQDKDLSYIFISHDLEAVRYICDEVLVLRHGQIVEAGSVEHVFQNPEHAYTKELLESI